ncbi:uncharacterized protein LOC132202112 isoform X2 [Neocloeon triangulifer]|uniref:uncharacterized protein LOC132202112 isoform X2 n=1 Tax=Neocloeon triangulifer TaxID=2078957 RepID=UPI00286EE129|nr:uncharacterized protein LOC132202112 isoform X2 [Neocloeon triangulifer]
MSTILSKSITFGNKTIPVITTNPPVMFEESTDDTTEQSQETATTSNGLLEFSSEATEEPSSNKEKIITTNIEVTKSIDIFSTLSPTIAPTTSTVMPTTTTTRPPLCNCQTCKIVSDDAISIKDPEKYGAWTRVDNATYLFGGYPMTWSNAWQKCCSLGMWLISFESFLKIKRVGEVIKNWPHNTQFWTSGTSKGCTNGTFVWCSSNDPQFETGSWHPNEPNEKNGSIDVCVSASLANGAFLLSDNPCSYRYAFACEANSIKFMENPVDQLQNGCPPKQDCGNNMLGLPTYNADGLIQEPGPIRGTFQISCG